MNSEESKSWAIALTIVAIICGLIMGGFFYWLFKIDNIKSGIKSEVRPSNIVCNKITRTDIETPTDFIECKEF